MFKNERLSLIIEALKHKKVMTTTDLQKQLFVSGSTIRRDLIELEKLGKVVRKFGYAELVKPDNLELSYLFREQENESAKRRIAETASLFLGDNQAIFVDSSSTASFLSSYFARLHNLIIITNGLRLAVELDGVTSIKTFVAGGRLRAGAGSILGDVALNFMDNFHADLTILSCTGVTASGVFMSSEEQSSVKRKMMALSDKAILLCDHSKFNQKSYYKLCRPSDFNAIVTDQKPDDGILKVWQQNDIDVLY